MIYYHLERDSIDNCVEFKVASFFVNPDSSSPIFVFVKIVIGQNHPHDESVILIFLKSSRLISQCSNIIHVLSLLRKSFTGRSCSRRNAFRLQGTVLEQGLSS